MSSIEWTDETWNPTRGCSRVSPGCDHCYAMGQAHRFDTPGITHEAGHKIGVGKYHGLTTIRRGKVDWSGEVRFVPEMLDRPLRWKRQRRIFVNSMSDLFHESLSNEQIAAVFGVMAACPQHTFQVLTKRPKRARKWFDWLSRRDAEGLYPPHVQVLELHARHHGITARAASIEWPLPNVWIGVSAEDQQRADERIPELLACPAAVHFVSIEPMLGAIEVAPWLHDSNCWELYERAIEPKVCICSEPREAHLDWVIVGGESGAGARPFDFAHARALLEQCQSAGVAFFLKQGGACALDTDNNGLAPLNLSDRKGGEPSEWPHDLRVRQWPEVRS